MAQRNTVTYPEDPNIIAYLFPADLENHQDYKHQQRAEEAIRDPQNSNLFNLPTLDAKDGSQLCSRESTVSLEGSDAEADRGTNVEPFLLQPSLQFTFSKMP